jgi:hypothetical protein
LAPPAAAVVAQALAVVAQAPDLADLALLAVEARLLDPADLALLA